MRRSFFDDVDRGVAQSGTSVTAKRTASSDVDKIVKHIDDKCLGNEAKLDMLFPLMGND